MIAAIVAVVVLAAVVAALLLDRRALDLRHAAAQQQWVAERAQLLNRIEAKNTHEFIALERTTAPKRDESHEPTPQQIPVGL